MNKASEVLNQDTDPEKDELEEQVKEIISARVNAFDGYRRHHSIEIKANIAYLAGHQNIAVENNQIVPLPKEYQIETVSNLLLPAVVNDVAVSTKVAPVYDILPAGSDEDDKATSIACQKILPYLQRINARDLHRGSVVLWYDIDGVGWRKVYWDTNHHVRGIAQEGDESGLKPGEAIVEGEVLVEHVPNTEVIYDHRITDLTKLTWIIQHKQVTKGWIRERYGEEFLEKVNDSKFSEQNLNVNDYELTIRDSFSDVTSSVINSSTNNNNVPNSKQMLEEDMITDCYEYWAIPTKKQPTGMFSTMIAGEIAASQPYPIEQYTHGQLPLIPCVPMPMSGIDSTSISRLTQARPLQREYNKIRSLILNNIDAQGNSIIMASTNANVRWEQVDNGSGNILTYDGPMKPSREMGTPIPNSLFAYITETKRGIEEIFAFHEPSKGIRPVGVDSAAGLQALQTADYTQLGPILSALEESDQKVVYQMLTLAISNYGNKILNIVGDDESWAVQEINASELQGKINVVVQRGSSTPLNKQQKSQEAMAVWQTGLLGDPNTSENRLFTLKQMQIPGIDGILKLNAKDISFARKEFHAAEAVLREMPEVPLDATDEQIFAIFEEYIIIPPPNTFDDHEVHIHEHKDYMMDKYWKFKETGAPQYLILLQAMMDHIMLHQQTMTEAFLQGKQAELQYEAFLKGNTLEQLALKHKDHGDSHDKTTKK